MDSKKVILDPKRGIIEVNVGMIDPKRRILVAYCEACGHLSETQRVYLKQNISYCFQREERTLCGYVCEPCMRRIFLRFEGNTLIMTWWGVIGLLVGPWILVSNLFGFLIYTYRSFRSRHDPRIVRSPYLPRTNR